MRPGRNTGLLPCRAQQLNVFPAVISLDEEQPTRTAAHALMTIALHDSEAGTFFAPGQRFTIWADAVVCHTIQLCQPKP
jgi:hypothetical protein